MRCKSQEESQFKAQGSTAPNLCRTNVFGQLALVLTLWFGLIFGLRTSGTCSFIFSPLPLASGATEPAGGKKRQLSSHHSCDTSIWASRWKNFRNSGMCRCFRHKIPLSFARLKTQHCCYSPCSFSMWLFWSPGQSYDSVLRDAWSMRDSYWKRD